jgi:hypothetical protein
LHYLSVITKPVDRWTDRQFDYGILLAIIADTAKGLQIVQTGFPALRLWHDMIGLQGVTVTDTTSTATAIVTVDHLQS